MPNPIDAKKNVCDAIELEGLAAIQLAGFLRQDYVSPRQTKNILKAIIEKLQWIDRQLPPP